MQRSGRPPAKYRQIAADLRARIESGEYPVDAQLPTRPEMAKEYDAAPGTVESALNVLRQLGLVESRQGSGSFVLRQHPGESEAESLAVQVASLRERVAELSRHVEADSELREIVSRIEANLIDLYGKTGFEYPEDGEGQERVARHG